MFESFSEKDYIFIGCVSSCLLPNNIVDGYDGGFKKLLYKLKNLMYSSDKDIDNGVNELEKIK